MGPPPSVKIAAPIPTHFFAPVPNLGPALNNLADVTMLFQQHTGSPDILPAAFHPPTGLEPLPVEWLPKPIYGWSWQRFFSRFRAQPMY